MGDFIGLNSERVRRDNLSAVLREVHRRGATSRSELALHTSLYRQTIRSLVGDLERRGLVSERPMAPEGTPGRPSLMVEARPDLVRALVIDIEVDSVGVGLAALGGAMLRSRRISRLRRPTDVARALDVVAGEAEAVLRDTDRSTIRAVGVAIVGIVRRRDGLVRLAPNLGWRDVPLADELRARLALDVPIVVANEADLGALAEHARGAAAGHGDLVYLSGEVGLGGGIIIDGRPLIGAGGHAGEIGHIVVNPGGHPCGCGSVGCWETEVGEAALLRRVGVVPEGPRDAAVARVVGSALRGDHVAAAAVAEVGRWMGIGLTGLVNTFNPQVVVFGGLFERLFPVLLPAVRGELERRVTPALLDGLLIRPSRFGTDAPMVGAAELALEGILADPLALPEVA